MTKLQTATLETPNYYKVNGEDLFTKFSNGLVPSSEYVGFLKCNAFKYLTRYNGKGQKESDLYKLKDYSQTLLWFEVDGYIREDVEKAIENVDSQIETLEMFEDDGFDDKKAMLKACIYDLLAYYDVKDNQDIKKENLLELNAFVDELIKEEIPDKDGK